MNKLYTLLLSLLLSAAATAQNLTITVDGEQWANGTTLTKVYDTDNYSFELMPGLVIPKYGLYPEIMISCDANQSVTATLTDEAKAGGVTYCFGGTCVALDANGYSVTKEAKLESGKPKDMQIEVVRQSAATAPYEVTLALRVDLAQTATRAASTFEGKLVLRYDPEAAHVNNITTSTASQYYTLSGQRVGQSPTKKGIYVKNGRKIVK